jgi:hypothetical protein
VGLRRKRFDHGLPRCLDSERRPVLGVFRNDDAVRAVDCVPDARKCGSEISR